VSALTSKDIAEKLLENVRVVAQRVEQHRNKLLNPDEQTIEFCGEVMNLTKQLKEESEDLHKAFGEIYRMYQQLIMPRRMREMGEDVTKFTVKNLGTFTLVPDFHVSILASAKEDAKTWLVEEGMGDLITETVNASSLKAALNARMKRIAKENNNLGEGEEPQEVLPPDDKFRFHSFEFVKLTKAK